MDIVMDKFPVYQEIPFEQDQILSFQNQTERENHTQILNKFYDF